MMVDTGSNDCELSGDLISTLGLRPFETALFETAAGITTEAPVFKARIHVMGREANVLLSPAEGESDDDDDDNDGEDEGTRPLTTRCSATTRWRRSASPWTAGSASSYRCSRGRSSFRRSRTFDSIHKGGCCEPSYRYN